MTTPHGLVWESVDIPEPPPEPPPQPVLPRQLGLPSITPAPPRTRKLTLRERLSMALVRKIPQPDNQTHIPPGVGMKDGVLTYDDAATPAGPLSYTDAMWGTDDEPDLSHLYEDVPDTAWLPQGYTGARPPAGWCNEGTTFFVPAGLRADYLEQLNDADAEQARRENLGTLDGVVIAVPDRFDVKRHQAQDLMRPHMLTRMFMIDLAEPQSRDLAMHHRRAEAAKVVVDERKATADAAAFVAAVRGPRTCGWCRTDSLTELPHHPRLTPDLPCCPSCWAVTQRLCTELDAAALVDTPDGPRRREDILANAITLHLEEN